MNFLDTLGQLQDISKVASNFAGRNIAPYLALVTNNDDPEDKRRIKVINPANPQLETTWLRRLDVTRGCDQPLPKVGETVLIFSVDGVDTNGWYLYCVNATNPAIAKEDVLNDFAFEGEGRYRVTAQNTITIEVASGAAIVINANGSVSIMSPTTVTLAANDFVINSDVTINADSVSINGIQVATVGALDSRGDSLTGRGW